MPSTKVGQNLTIFLFFTLLSVSGLLWLAINTGQRFGPLPPEHRVAFVVSDADGLTEGNDVRVAGIQVGKVLSIQTVETGAQVTMGIDPLYVPIYSDATVL